jgi:hypothetical protein
MRFFSIFYSQVNPDLVTTAAIPAADDVSAWTVAPSSAPVASAPVTPKTPLPSGTPNLAISPASLSFGNVATNTSVLKTFTLTNTGDALLTFSSAGFAGTSAYSQDSSTCAATPAAGATCSVTVRYAPTAGGEALESFNLVSDAPNSPATVALSSVAYNPVSFKDLTTGAGVLPAGVLNKTYPPYDFGGLLDVSNEASFDKSMVTWSQPSGLPEGMTFDIVY